MITDNQYQKDLVLDKLHDALGTLAGRRVAVLGLSFKPNTSDVRESPGLSLCQRLLALGAQVRAFDPVAIAEAVVALGPAGRSVHFAKSVNDATYQADALVIMTEWNEFRSLDLSTLGTSMRQRVILDMRNVLDPASARAAGFAYVGTGRGMLASGRVPA